MISFAFEDRLRGKLPGLLFWAGAGTVMASAFPPWRLATTPLIHGPGGQFLAGFALVVGGFVGLAMLVRGPNILAAAWAATKRSY